MVTIKLNPYERQELLRYLEYAKSRKLIDQVSRNEKFDTTQYDIERINVLIDRVNGICNEDYLLNSKAYRRNIGTSDKSKQEVVTYDIMSY